MFLFLPFYKRVFPPYWDLDDYNEKAIQNKASVPFYSSYQEYNEYEYNYDDDENSYNGIYYYLPYDLDKAGFSYDKNYYVYDYRNDDEENFYGGIFYRSPYDLAKAGFAYDMNYYDYDFNYEYNENLHDGIYYRLPYGLGKIGFTYDSNDYEYEEEKNIMEGGCVLRPFWYRRPRPVSYTHLTLPTM